MRVRNIKTFLIIFCIFSILFVFSGCAGEREIYAESSDFATYPDYWNDFNSSHDSTDSSKNTTGETEIITDDSSVDNSIIDNPSSESASTDVSSGENSSSDSESSVDSESTPSEDENTEDTTSQPDVDMSHQGPIVFF